MSEGVTDGGLNLTVEISAIVEKPGHLGLHDGGQRLRQLYMAGKFAGVFTVFFFLINRCQNGDTLIQPVYQNLGCYVALDNWK